MSTAIEKAKLLRRRQEETLQFHVEPMPKLGGKLAAIDPRAVEDFHQQFNLWMERFMDQIRRVRGEEQVITATTVTESATIAQPVQLGSPSPPSLPGKQGDPGLPGTDGLDGEDGAPGPPLSQLIFHRWDDAAYSTPDVGEKLYANTVQSGTLDIDGKKLWIRYSGKWEGLTGVVNRFSFQIGNLNCFSFDCDAPVPTSGSFTLEIVITRTSVSNIKISYLWWSSVGHIALVDLVTSTGAASFGSGDQEVAMGFTSFGGAAGEATMEFAMCYALTEV